MKLIDAIGNVAILFLLRVVLEVIAIKHGYTGDFASEDARLIFSGLVIAGTLMSRD